MRVHQLAAPGLNAAVALGQLELHLIGQRDAVLHRHLVERAGDRALHAGAVVTPDPDDQRVVQLAKLGDRVDDPADVVVGVLRVPGVDLHLARVVGLQLVRDLVPGGERLVPRRQLRVRWDHTQFLLPGEDLLAKMVPALVELALVLIRPFGGDMVRGVAAPGGEVDEERLAGVLRPDPVQPLDGLIGHRIRQVVRVLLVIEAFRGADDLLVLGQARIPLPRISAQEAVEVVKAPPVRPPPERPGRALLAIGRQMPLAERRGAVPVLRQDPRPRRAITRNHRRVPREATGELTHRAETDRMVVPPGQQRRPRRRAQRGHMEPVVTQPPFSHPRVVRGVNGPTERARVTKTGVIDQHQQDIRGPLRRLSMPDQVPVRHRPRQRPIAHPPKRWPANRQPRAVRLAHPFPTPLFSTHRRRDQPRAGCLAAARPPPAPRARWRCCSVSVRRTVPSLRRRRTR